MDVVPKPPTRPPSRFAETVAALTPTAQDDWLAALTPRLTKYIPHDPTAIPQQAVFLLLDDEEALYGGAAGGGKTDALLASALQYVDIPGYDAILIRRTFPELRMPGSLLDRANDWLGPTDARWDGLNGRWRFPSGATVGFGYLQNEQDKHRYQSAEFSYIGVDELTTFTASQYLYLHSRLRRPSSGAISHVPSRMRAGSNPGGIGHEWVRQRFLIEKRGTYIPARLWDNPFIDIEEYAARLWRLDPVTRAQLMDGDWEAVAQGNMFRPERLKVIEVAPKTLRRVRRWDLASGTEEDSDATAGVLMGITADDTYVIFDVVRLQGDVADVDQAIFNAAVQDGRGTAIRIEQEPGSSGVRTIKDFVRRLRGYDVRGEPSTGSKELRARPLSAQWHAGNVMAVRGPWLTAYVDEMKVFPNPSAHDDQVDASSGAFADLTFVRAGRFKAYD